MKTTTRNGCDANEEAALDAISRPPRVHNGTYTIESPAGGHRTFRISTERFGGAAGTPVEVKRVLSLLVGPENTADYLGFGFVDDAGIRIWKRYRSDGPGFRLFSVHARTTCREWTDHEKFAWMTWDLAVRGSDGELSSRGYRLLLLGTCVRCNRPLTTPESIDAGIGPVCAGRGR
uniref:Uncharacterized protein n=1 Tax=viral metagenome TaxID=1070528 RepID=A0A6M3J8V2_9ZZZZ